MLLKRECIIIEWGSRNEIKIKIKRNTKQERFKIKLKLRSRATLCLHCIQQCKWYTRIDFWSVASSRLVAWESLVFMQLYTSVRINFFFSSIKAKFREAEKNTRIVTSCYDKATNHQLFYLGVPRTTVQQQQLRMWTMITICNFALSLTSKNQHRFFSVHSFKKIICIRWQLIGIVDRFVDSQIVFSLPCF